MSYQAGVYYFDGRPILPEEASAILATVSCEDHGPPVSWQEPGLFMAQAGVAHPGVTFAIPTGHNATHPMTFDGRIDNREDLALRLRDRLAGDAADSDLALAAYEAWDVEGLANLVGDWSLVVWDAPKHCLLLASDYAGVRPLYYWCSDKCIRWSTRLAPLLRFTGATGIEDQYVAAFLTRGGSLNRTPFQGLFSVPTGHYVAVSPGGTACRAFWRLPAGAMTRFPREQDYDERLRELFQDAIRSRLRWPEPAMAELSGGLDSSSIICMANRILGGDRDRLVSLTYDRPHSLDAPFHRAVEEWCGNKSVHLPAEGQLCFNLSSAGQSYPAYWGPLHNNVAKAASECGAHTLLTGQLGDLVMGNWWDDSAQVAGLFKEGHVRGALQSAWDWSRALNRPFSGILWNGLLTALSLPIQWSAEWSAGAPEHDTSLASSFWRRMQLGDPDRFIRSDWREAPVERQRHFRSLAEALQMRKLQAPEPLTHLEYTHPYAHRPLLAYLMSLPSAVLCGPGERRRLMRRAFRALWPPQLASRRSKDSFGQVFYDALRPVALRLSRPDERLEVVERGYVDRKSFLERLERCIHYLDCNQPQLRLIVVLELWLRLKTA